MDTNSGEMLDAMANAFARQALGDLLGTLASRARKLHEEEERQRKSVWKRFLATTAVSAVVLAISVFSF